MTAAALVLALLSGCNWGRTPQEMGEPMGIYQTKAVWQRVLERPVRHCTARHLSPDLFTGGALVVSTAAALGLARAGREPWWLLLVALLLLLRLAFNLMDGQIARRRGVAGPWGEVKNEIGDRLSDAVILIGLLVGGVNPVAVVLLLALVTTSAIAGLLGRVIGGERLYDGLYGKGERMLLLALVALVVAAGGPLELFEAYVILGAPAAAETLLQRLGRLHALAA